MIVRRRSRSRYNRFSDYGGWGGFAPYVPVAARKAQAKRKLQSLQKSGHTVSPVEITGRKIATTFWGAAWCDNLERYSDYSNRIPRGRTYVRNGSVVDLQIGAGQVDALVSGSSLYTVVVKVAPVPAPRWRTICGRCAGGIDSLVELLQGRFSTAVMEHLCQQGTGLFPTPAEIAFTCSCPDWASMCKHVAAVLYGVGARLDHRPELLFRLRQVNEQELIARAGADVPLSGKGPAAAKVLKETDLADVFGVELAPPVSSRTATVKKRASVATQVAAKAVKPAGVASRAAAIGAKPTAVVPRRPKRAPVPAAAAAPAPTRPAATPSQPIRGRKTNVPPPGVTAAPSCEDRRAPGRKTMTAAQRKAVSERMRRYWEARRRR
jgi:uncharacterized Zn finger protein